MGDPQEQIKGEISAIIFRNDDNGFTVFVVDTDDDHITAVGSVVSIAEGDAVTVTGVWVKHPEFGRQMKVSMLEKTMPESSDAIEKYLASGLVKGVGPSTAKKIVARFGKDTLTVIMDSPERLSEVKGIRSDKAEAIAEALREQHGAARIVVALQNMGLEMPLAVKVHKALGANAIDVMKENPYRLAEEVRGFGFRTADKIARNMGHDMMAHSRLHSGLSYVLSEASAQGHIYLPWDLWMEQARRLLEAPASELDAAAKSRILSGQIIRQTVDGQEAVYLPSYLQAENMVAHLMTQLASKEEKSIRDLDDKISRFEERRKIALHPVQREALKMAATHPVSVITGGPGTGKTTIVQGLVHLFEGEGLKTALTAPTGRAAKRLTEATGQEAFTLHRFLGAGGRSDENDDAKFTRDEDSPITEDVVIVDETSMVDLLLMETLMRAMREDSHLVLVGDADQLPSVGPGNVLRDIVASDVIPVTRLTAIFRQGSQSMIAENAHKILRGEMPQFNQKDSDCFFMPAKSPEEAMNLVADLVSRRLPQRMGFNPKGEIAVLAPWRKQAAGVEALNLRLQQALNAQPDGKGKVSRGFTWYKGDRCIQTRNNYQAGWSRGSEVGEGLFNGDTGTVTDIDFDDGVLTVLFDDEREARIDFAFLEDVDPAYALTVHKSQGSEYPVVILSVLPGPPMLLHRNLLYTAVTRAKKLLIIVGSEDTVKQMVRNQKEQQRYSALKQRLMLLSRN